MKKKIFLALFVVCFLGLFWVVGRVENGAPLCFSLWAIPFLAGAFSCIYFGNLYEGEE